MFSKENIEEVCRQFSLDAYVIQFLTHGNIHQTYEVCTKNKKIILQRLHKTFSPESIQDRIAISDYLSLCGLRVAKLYQTVDQQWLFRDKEGYYWRAQEKLEGFTIVGPARHPATCFAAGKLLGKWHSALSTFDYTFQGPERRIHQLRLHMERLSHALDVHSKHRAFQTVLGLYKDIKDLFLEFHFIEEDRIVGLVHGDPKLDNFIFLDETCASSIIDLDTFSYQSYLYELGDALRSWCNDCGESGEGASLNLEHVDAALHGYAAGSDGLLRLEHAALIPHALVQIALELASRFAQDALVEQYFAWDKTKYKCASEHHILRARNQLLLAKQALSSYASLSTFAGRYYAN
jgi:Ser/Thr protein kinase RdoA (MazF antagonist)